MKVAHLADVHIRNLKYHDVYENVFNQLYDSLKKEGVDAIVVCGDIAHTKTQISPEYVQMASDFFRSLSRIAPTLILPGNHDGNLRNLKRLDAITPVYENIKADCPDLYYMKEAGVFDFGSGFDVDLVFYHLSVFSPQETWPELDTSTSSINVALYHGLIRGVKTDTGYVMTHGDVDIDAFEGFDFVFLGDVHRTNQILDPPDGRVRYPGSLIQQNFGETNDKGYLLWDIKNNEDFTCTHVPLQTPKPFITIEVAGDTLPPDLFLPTNSRVRVSAEGNVPLDKVKKMVDFIKMNYDVESVSYRNKNFSKSSSSMIDDEFSKKNLRDLAVQEELIRDYLKDFSIEEDTIQRVLSINKTVDAKIEDNDIFRNVNWLIKNVKFDNLFNYSEGNNVDFEKLEGIVGIFGPNRSGKSSIIDAILFAVFNTTSKPVRKSVNYINQNKEEASATVEIEMNGQLYRIIRKLTKKEKKSGELHASTEADFSVLTDKKWKSLNGDTRWDTERNIRKHFGTVDDFLMTSMTSQFGSLMFIEQKSTDRKKILAKFLDLEVFEEKYKIANEDLKDLRGAVRMLEKSDFSEDKRSAAKDLADSKKSLRENKEKCGEIKKEIKQLKNEAKETEEALSNLKAENVDIDKVERDHREAELYLEDNIPRVKTKKSAILDAQKVLVSHLSCSSTQVDDAVASLSKEKRDLSTKVGELQSKIRKFDKNKKFIEDAPCNSEYSDCMLVQEAKEFFENLNSKELWEKELSSSNLRLVEIEKILKLERKIINTELEVSRFETNISKNESRLKDLSELIEYYYGNIDTIKNKKEYEQKLLTIKQNLRSKNRDLTSCESNTEELTRKIGYLEQKIENIDENMLKLEDFRKEYIAYDLYKTCVHNNGIPFEVIKMRLPAINEEMSKVLTNIVKFDVLFENSDNKLDINIKYPKYDPREIEMGSGAEKMISAMAIRLALLSISSLPKSEIFVLDEPATELDEDSMEGFTRILDSVKDYFRNVVLISHIDSLKDVVDRQIIIEKKGGYAHVEV